VAMAGDELVNRNIVVLSNVFNFVFIWGRCKYLDYITKNNSIINKWWICNGLEGKGQKAGIA
jgi:hypothetical protein